MEEPKNQTIAIDVNGQTKMTYDLTTDIDGPTIEVQQIHHLVIVAQYLFFLQIFYPCHICQQGKQKGNNL